MTNADRTDFDIAIIGAGIVGAAVAHFTAPRLRVLLLEAEATPGYHTTGRSAALYAPAYGPPQVRALTRASRAFFDAPPAGFASVPLLKPRPSMFVGGESDREALLAMHAHLLAEGIAVELLDGEQAQRRVPVLRPEACTLALVDPGSSDIDVDALLQGFLRGARAAGAQLARDARISTLQADAAGWQLTAADGRQWRARQVVNAAGAWADEVGALAGVPRIGLEPRRRTAFVFEPPAGVAIADWPAVVAADESWYLKPEAGLLLGSPANADPVHPHDVVAEEFDVALGIHRIESATTLQIRRPRRTWAGLRCFVADGEPVCGPDPAAPGFFWAAALGGYGIQSSPAFGQLCAALLCSEAPPAALQAQGLQIEALRAGRPLALP
jgi:D-arginine dehydrogenase